MWSATKSNLSRRRGRRKTAFTLIELLVAAAIAALLMMTAIPYVREVQKKPLVRAITALVDGCREARLQAILKDRPYQVVIYDSGGAIGVEPVPNDFPNSSGPVSDQAHMSDDADAAAAKRAPFQAQIDDEVAFRRLLVNGRDRMAAEAVAIRFFPNGTSDALDAELQWLRNDVRRITLDILTGQPMVQGVR